MADGSDPRYEALCKGSARGCACSLTDLKGTGFSDATKTLIGRVKDVLDQLQKGTERKVVEYRIGSSFVRSRKKTGAAVDPMNHKTWRVRGGLPVAWKFFNNEPNYFDGLVVLACVNGQVVPKQLKATKAGKPEQYALALQQAVLHNFMLLESDARCTNLRFSPPNPPGNRCGIIFVAFKYEDQVNFDVLCKGNVKGFAVKAADLGKGPGSPGANLAAHVKEVLASLKSSFPVKECQLGISFERQKADVELNPTDSSTWTKEQVINNIWRQRFRKQPRHCDGLVFLSAQQAKLPGKAPEGEEDVPATRALASLGLEQNMFDIVRAPPLGARGKIGGIIFLVYKYQRKSKEEEEKEEDKEDDEEGEGEEEGEEGESSDDEEE